MAGSEIEKAVLACMLQGRYHLRYAAERLTPEQFTEGRSELFATIVDCWRRDGQVDPVLIGPEAGNLATTRVEPGLVHRYVDELARQARNRRVRQVATQLNADPSRASELASDLLHDRAVTDAGPASAIRSAQDLMDDFDRLLEGEGAAGTSTGWPNVDGVFTLAEGMMTVVTGAPHAGKSSWVDALAVNLSEQNGWKHMVWSPENWPAGLYHVPRLIQRHIRRPVDPKAEDLSDTFQGYGWVDEHFSWIDPTEVRDHRSILTAAEIQMRRRPYQLLILDPFTNLDRPEGVREHDYTGTFLSDLRAFVQTHRIHAIVVAHPTKLRDSSGKTANRVPSLWDISGSSHWANMVDHGLVVWRESASDNRVLIRSRKARFRQYGDLGDAWLTFDPHDYRFSRDLKHEQEQIPV